MPLGLVAAKTTKISDRLQKGQPLAEQKDDCASKMPHS